MDVSVQMFSGIGQVTQARRSDAFTYGTRDTPYISWISDTAATGGGTLTLRALLSHELEHALCRNSKSRAFSRSLRLDQERCSAELYQIRVGETLCETDQDELPLRATQWNGYHDLIDCKLATDQAAGRHNLTVTQMQIAPEFDSCPNMGNRTSSSRLWFAGLCTAINSHTLDHGSMQMCPHNQLTCAACSVPADECQRRARSAQHCAVPWSRFGPRCFCSSSIIYRGCHHRPENQVGRSCRPFHWYCVPHHDLPGGLIAFHDVWWNVGRKPPNSLWVRGMFLQLRGVLCRSMCKVCLTRWPIVCA